MSLWRLAPMGQTLASLFLATLTLSAIELEFVPLPDIGSCGKSPLFIRDVEKSPNGMLSFRLSGWIAPGKLASKNKLSLKLVSKNRSINLECLPENEIYCGIPAKVEFFQLGDPILKHFILERFQAELFDKTSSLCKFTTRAPDYIVPAFRKYIRSSRLSGQMDVVGATSSCPDTITSTWLGSDPATVLELDLKFGKSTCRYLGGSSNSQTLRLREGDSMEHGRSNHEQENPKVRRLLVIRLSDKTPIKLKKNEIR